MSSPVCCIKLVIYEILWKKLLIIRGCFCLSLRSPLLLSYPLLFFGSFLCFYFVWSARFSLILATYHCCYRVHVCCDFNHHMFADIRFPFSFYSLLSVGRDSAVGTETRYGLHGPGIESRCGRGFSCRPNRPWGPLSLLHNKYCVSFPGGNWVFAWHWSLNPIEPRG
jgi:hypothetical protein